jgi:hypothetical protein
VLLVEPVVAAELVGNRVRQQLGQEPQVVAVLVGVAVGGRELERDRPQLARFGQRRDRLGEDRCDVGVRLGRRSMGLLGRAGELARRREVEDEAVGGALRPALDQLARRDAVVGGGRRG